VCRCVEHYAVVELGDLLDAEPEVIDNAFEFRAPGTNVARNGLKHGHPGIVVCNTPGVCHSLSSGFELKHDRLSRDDDVKTNLRR
jgi:hypothetical protein